MEKLVIARVLRVPGTMVVTVLLPQVRDFRPVAGCHGWIF